MNPGTLRLVELFVAPALSDGDFHAVDASLGKVTLREMCVLVPGPLGPVLVVL